MTDTLANNRRIARNTLMLYLRMLFVMAISLYTSRILLNVLGVIDYGICNVVSGVVTIFNFISGALTTSAQRFLSFELGKNDTKRLKGTFTSCLIIHYIAACFICLFVEIIGCWLLYNKLIIPVHRFDSALWVFHLGVISLWFSIISIPYTACVVSHEKMGMFALMSVINAILKAIVVFLLVVSTFDHLKYYAVLSLATSILSFGIYLYYCKSHFQETTLTKNLDKSGITKIFSFASWNMIGQLAYILFSQGIDILLNVFFGPAINAARAISTQVQGAIGQLSYNFQSAINPQITKSYAIGDEKRMSDLTFISTKISFFLLLIITIPFSTETSTILSVWLKNVPEHAIAFTQISIWITLLDGVSNPLMTVAAATGKIKLYQIVVGGILLVIVPISYFFLKMGYPPYSVFVVHLTLSAVSFMARILIIRKLTNINIFLYIKAVVFRCIAISAISLSIAILIKQLLSYDSYSFCLMRILATTFTTLILFFTIGLCTNERHFIIHGIKSYLKRVSIKNR